MEEILRDLCLFDEHTWGASSSISAPYSLRTLAQYVEKSDLAYKPMGFAEKLLLRRVRAKIDPLPEGLYVVNPAPVEVSGWASISAVALPRDSRSLADTATGAKIDLVREAASSDSGWRNSRPSSMRSFRPDPAAAEASSRFDKPGGETGFQRLAAVGRVARDAEAAV